jgi:large conductance mechanosensitive channel
MMKEFKAFVLRGNVLDLAVAIVIGGAFGKIVASLVNDLIMPIIGMIMGGVNFVNLKYIITPASEGVEEAAIRYGAFIQSIIDFVIIAFAIFIVIKLIVRMQKKKEEAAAAPAEPPRQEILLEEIRDLLKK